MTELGKILDGPGEKDAVHIATKPVQAGMMLQRAAKIYKETDGKWYPCDHATHNPKDIGIVDPFLQEDFVGEGMWFLLCLNPNTVTSLGHHWKHPAFEDEDLVKVIPFAEVVTLEPVKPKVTHAPSYQYYQDEDDEYDRPGRCSC